MRSTPRLPRPVRLSVWANAWSSGQASLDEAVALARGDDPPHVVAAPDGAPEPLIMGFRRIFEGETALAVLPVPGFLLGLAGPDGFNKSAVATGGAVLADGTGLIPEAAGDLVVWHTHEIVPSHHYESLREAGLRMREALAAAAASFQDAELRPAREALLDELVAAERPVDLPLPVSFDEADERLIVTALRCLSLTQGSLADHTADLSASAATLRTTTLRALDHAARRVLVAASAHHPRR